MMIRGMLFLLFLYTLLVWIVAFYLGGEIVQRGLFWTGVGVAGLLLWLILDRVVAWLQARRAKTVAKPAAAAAPAAKVSPEAAAIRELIEEANSQLAQAPSLKGSATSIFDLPLYLLVGPEGAGKTTIILNSGMEPHPLAGQSSPSGQDPSSTRVANIWLAKGAIYLEIGGRVFNGDSARFAEWLAELAPKPKLSPTLALFAKTKLKFLTPPSQQPQNLRGVLVVGDMREFLRASDMSKLDRFAALVRERLDAISTHFGVTCPVYMIFSRTDQVPYFREFFGRMTENDSSQVFGALTANEAKLAAGEVWAESETRRLNAHFNQLFLRLSDRRLQALTTEPDMQARPAVYEFPREFKRSRTPLIQFLVDIFRPNPLKQAPQLRGFFFTGMRMVARSMASPGGDTQILGGNADAGATQIFRPEMTTVFSAASIGKPAGPLVPAWAFLTDLFNRAIPSDRPALAPIAVADVKPWQRKPVIATAIIGAILVAGFTTSWLRNWNLISRTRQQVETITAQSGLLSVPNLQSVDDLRASLETLEESKPWSLRWGLYSGDDVLRLGQEAYFKRLKVLFMAGADGSLVGSLTQGQSLQGVPLYDQLKTYVTVTTKACPVDQGLVSNVLRQAVATWKPGLEPQVAVLVDRQLKYYAKVLQVQPTPPISFAQDQKAVGSARAALLSANGFEPQLNALLNEVAKQLPKMRVADRVPEYTRVLAGPDEMPPQFTKAGATLMESLIEAGNWGNSGEECVTGKKTNVVAGAVQSSESKKQLRDLYYLRYAQAWRTFLHSYRVLAYGSRPDAAAKLDTLSSSQSPLLMVVKLVAENTNFPQKANEPSYWETTAQKVGLGDIVGRLKKGQQKAEEVQQLVTGPAGLTAADVTRLMQPVQVSTPPALGVLVNESNQAYVMGLRGLQQSLEAISRGSDADVLTLIPQAQQALAQARSGFRSLADKFADTGNQGLNRELADLLEQPIKYADAVIPRNTGAFSAGKQNGDLAAVCKDIGPVLSKYPFNPLSSVDVNLAEVKRVFGPGTGAIWQFQQKTLPEVVAKEGSAWVQAKPMPRVTASLLAFLSRAQQLTDVFFAGGNAAATPHVSYALRRVSDKPPILLHLDGVDMNTGSSGLRVEFTWPGASPAQQGAEGNLGDASLRTGFGKYDGLWGVFRLFQYADNRPLGEKAVQWSQIRGPGIATPQSISPPAKLEFVRFPNDVDLFNPRFFDGLKCPTQAVVPE